MSIEEDFSNYIKDNIKYGNTTADNKIKIVNENMDIDPLLSNVDINKTEDIEKYIDNYHFINDCQLASEKEYLNKIINILNDIIINKQYGKLKEVVILLSNLGNMIDKTTKNVNAFAINSICKWTEYITLIKGKDDNQKVIPDNSPLNIILPTKDTNTMKVDYINKTIIGKNEHKNDINMSS